MLKYIILGTIQGLTEFLPVSSSGHLVIAQKWLGISQDAILLDIILHCGTVLALLVFFHKEILAVLKNKKWLGYIALSTAATALIGITFRSFFESVFFSERAVAGFLFVNGVILILTKFLKKKTRPICFSDAPILGVAQGCAIIPGISRSGLTITTLLARGVEKEEAFRFSFLASIPAVIGAFLLETGSLTEWRTLCAREVLAGLITSFVFGLMALFILFKAIKKGRLHFFGYYCMAAGLFLLIA